MELGILDRFEEDIAVIELKDRSIKNIPKNKIPLNAKEGDVLNIIDDIITVDKEATEKLHKQLDTLMNELFKK